MTAFNKRALRAATEAANIASWGKWESYKPHKGARGYEVKVGAKAVAQHCLKVDAAFIAAANPQTVLALLDELEKDNCSNVHYTDAAEMEIAALRQRIAELEARTVTVQLPADNAAESESPEDDATAWFDEGWNARGKADKEALIAAGIGVKGE